MNEKIQIVFFLLSEPVLVRSSYGGRGWVWYGENFYNVIF